MMGKLIYKLLPAVSCAALLFGLSGCGRDEIHIRIFDRQTETRAVVLDGITVQEALLEAELAVGQGDIVSPDFGEAVTEGTDIFIRRKVSVTVAEDGQEREMAFTGGQVKDAIHTAGIKIGKHDELNHDLQAYLWDGMDIRVTHRHLVMVDADGEAKECLTAADTVGELLEEQDIRLDAKDQLTPGLDTCLEDGMEIAIRRVFVKQVSEYEEIPFETKIEYSGGMFEDESRQKQQGRNGRKELIYEAVYVDGEEESRRLVEERVVEQPTSSIIVRGTAARRRIVSREQVYDCDGSGHGYYVITWSDGTVEYEDF